MNSRPIALFTATVFLLTGVTTMLANGQQPFSVSPDEGFAVKLNGVVIATLKDPCADPAAKLTPEANGFTVLGADLRKEFALFENRIEYTFDFALPAPAAQTLSIFLPLPEDATATVTHGMTDIAPPPKESFAGGNQTTQGKSVSPLRYITVKSEKSSFSVDTQPMGACGEDRSYAETPLRIFRCRRSSEGLEISAAIPAGYVGYPAHLKGKVIFYVDARSFEEVHPFAYAFHYGALERYLSLDFTDRKPRRKTDPTPTAAQPYSSERKYGWLSDPAALVVRSTSLPTSVHGAFITSDHPAKFRIDAPAGYYYLTLNFGNADGPTGPLRVRVNGEERLSRVQLDKGRFKNESLLVKLYSPPMLLELEGLDGAPWLLNGLIVEPLGTLNEDFTFTRPWWHFKHESAIQSY